MTLFKNKYRVESVRLPGYDYSQPGAYYITIVVHNRQCLFGNVVDGKMMLNEFGELVKTEWLKTGVIRPNIDVDSFIVMPNHLHGILIITDNDNQRKDASQCQRRDTSQRVSTRMNEQFGKPTHNSIPTIVRLFKSTTTKQINQIRKTPMQPLWQRGYYEHVVRDEDDLNRIREYIINNLQKWEFDKLNHLL